MKIQDIIVLFENKLTALNNEKAMAITLGNFSEVLRLDSEISETQDSLNSLRGL
jgi:hypothetical protein